MPGTSSQFMSAHEIVRAGAGAGKTYTLTHKVMDIAADFLKREKRFPRLIVTTFTRKATQELRERLMLLALDERPALIDFVNSRSNLVVSTIHGILDLYLKRYGGAIQLDPAYKIVSGDEAGKIARQALRHLVFADQETGGLLESFPFNRLVSLVRHLHEIAMANPAAAPFSFADFQALFRQRAGAIAKELRDAAVRIKVESTQATWLEMADEYLRLAGLLEEEDWAAARPRFEAVFSAMKTGRRNAKAPPVAEETADLAEQARKRAKKLIDEPVFDPSVWSDFAAMFEKIDRLARRFGDEFRATKMRAGLLEISDLELLAMDCARRHPQTAEAFQAEWDYWLVDEYQDTSPFQVELLKVLSGPRPSFIVGDPQQSIYLFRGARSEVFGLKEEEIRKNGGRLHYLKMNRRSCPELLLFINDLFARFDPPFSPMEPFVKSDEPMDPDRVVATYFISPLSETPRDGAEDEAAESQVDPELRAIAVHVHHLLAKGARPEDICVLGRTNRTLIAVAAHLAAEGLPTHVHSAGGFYDRRETRDALAFFKFLVNPHDNQNLIEVLRSPWYRVPDRALVEITTTLKKDESLWTKLLAASSTADEFKSTLRLQDLSQAATSAGLSGAFERGLVEAGFVDLSHLQDVSGRRESNIWKLLSQLRDEESRAGFNPIQFFNGTMGTLRLEEGNAEGDAVAAVEPDRINLMTVHSSKGLEFKHVIIPRMHQRPRLTTSEELTYDEGLGKWATRIPHGEDRDMLKSLPEEVWLERFQAQELREHARVLYVAVTRAIETVFMSWNAKVEKNSWAEMTSLVAAPGVHREEGYSFAVLNEVGEFKNERKETRAALAVREKWKASTAEPGCDGRAFSVTDLVEGRVVRDYSVATSPDVIHRLKVASQGTAIHRLMELLKYRSPELLHQLIQKWFPEQEERVLAAVEFVRDLAVPPLMEIIQNGAVEWGFAFTEKDVLVEGQVDLWGRAGDGRLWIVDYKTGSPELVEKAMTQMALYALALRKAGVVHEDEEIHLAAVYPFAQKVLVEKEPPRARTTAMLSRER